MELVAVQGAMSLVPAAAEAWGSLRAEVYAKYRVSLFLSSPGGAWRSDAMVRDMYLNPAKYGATKGVAKPRSLGGPGSVHENGRCIDINNWAAVGLKNLEPIAARHGFARTIPKEQWHFEYRGGGSGGNQPAPEPVIDYALLRRQKEEPMYVRGESLSTVVYAVFTDANGKMRLRKCEANEAAIALAGGIVILATDETLTNLGVAAGYREGQSIPLPEVAGGSGGGTLPADVATKAHVDAAADRMIAQVPPAVIVEQKKPGN